MHPSFYVVFQPEGWPQQLLLQLLHLMCRVEKSTWYIFKKTLYSRDTPSCSAPCKYLEIQRSSFLKFQYQATQIFLLWDNNDNGKADSKKRQAAKLDILGFMYWLHDYTEYTTLLSLLMPNSS